MLARVPSVLWLLLGTSGGVIAQVPDAIPPGPLLSLVAQPGIPPGRVDSPWVPATPPARFGEPTALPAESPGGGTFAPWTPAGSLPAFAGPVRVMLASDGAPPGTQAFARDPVLGALLGDLQVTVGFEYLRPVYPSSATALVIPAGAAGAFPIRGALGNVTQDFAFIPRFGIEYSFPDTAGLGVAASGKLFTLQGGLRRTVTGAGATGVLNAESSLSIGSANVFEGLIRFDLKRLERCRGTWLEQTTLLGSFGGRYAYVRQDLNVSVTSGDNLAALTATQDFTGFGFTGSAGALTPLGKSVGLYGLSRGSLLAGRNNRSSTFSTVAPALLGGSLAGQLTEQKTQLIPVGEFELGLTWGVPMRPRTTGTGPDLKPILWLRGGALAQVWGGLGLPDSPPASPLQGASFRGNPLVLVGFTVQAGLSF